MNECAMQYAIFRQNNNWKDCYPNIYIPGTNAEIDVLRLTKTNRCIFYEIKISYADFLRDMKKPRHGQLVDGSFPIMPSRFWYVIYGFDVPKDKIPVYSGVLRVTKACGLVTEMKAPLLNGTVLTACQVAKLDASLVWRFRNLMIKKAKEIWEEKKDV